ncbi:replication-associated protein [robinz virus RP_244]|nr:replication-associated protein [robinz virus RP_244]
MSQLIRWDGTLGDQDWITPLTLKVILKKGYKKWVFKKERGLETGYVHYQIKMALKKKLRLGTLKKIWAEANMEEVHLSPSHLGEEDDDWKYVTKEDTRIEGPWSYLDFDEDEVMPDLRRPLRPWQNDVREYIRGAIHDREVLAVVNPTGNIGKSWFCRYVRAYRLGTVIPPMGRMEDISAMVMCKPVDRCYVIDVPRGIRLTSDFWNGIELLKNGYCYDKRHSFKDRTFPIPHVIVFMNEVPERARLIEDRWRYLIV